jgi:hypothetical protein
MDAGPRRQAIVGESIETRTVAKRRLWRNQPQVPPNAGSGCVTNRHMGAIPTDAIEALIGCGS